jgi:flagellar FliL protein
MQASVAVMTHYDDRVIENVEKHVFALRNVMLMVMSQQTEADLVDPQFRTNLAEEFRLAMNAELEALEDFGGIEAVYLTEFVVQ